MGSTWTNTETLAVGRYGNATVQIRNGGSVVTDGNSTIAVDDESTSAVTVDGEGSNWTTNGILSVGQWGNGSLFVVNDGTVTSTSARIGDRDTSTGKVSIDGAGAIWTLSDSLQIGLNGSGSLKISSGGVAITPAAAIGVNGGSNGEVTVDGFGSSWSVNEFLTVGRVGDAQLYIVDGGNVNCEVGWIASNSTSNGRVILDGSGSTLATSGELRIGQYGNGRLTITNHGLTSVAGTLIVDFFGNTNSHVDLATGGQLALFGDADDSISQFLDLVEGTDAIRYWDHDLLQWSHITTGTLGDDYTLEYLTTGDLAGYTLLTVGSLDDLPDLPGDFNNDGFVNAADYTVWRDNLGTEVSLPNEATTFGQVTSEDYNTWRANFGSVAVDSSHTGANVPEPASLALAGCLVAAGLIWRGRSLALAR